MDLLQQILTILDNTLSLQGRTAGMERESPLLGAIPELDSMAVVAIIAAVEERFDVVFEDDEIDGQSFATVGSLVDTVAAKLG
ncbi:acyl carrier protein [Pseudothauera rhizosphaerae]|uniref:Acyl carrier protein n=1 Tax=Pseudothauera rhizosphaerae TaxID=2565932 RepID=A0A4S4APJ7_9RHOO|nr:acyl carrier protein [Pseudothauera rhizosphaerae]THF61615.1 acyl carrier protein [Pseudothauera rhizosphaerae]